MKKLKVLKKHLLVPTAILIFLILTTTLVILFGKGYRIGFNKGPNLTKTGLLVAKSNPDGAQVLIDGHLTTATNNTINLTPGEYKIEINKDGYFPWQKKVKMQQEVVTQADALLFPIAPRLDSISTLAVINPLLDPSGTKIAFQIASISARKNGIYVVNMATNTVSVPVLTVQSSSTQIVDDTVAPFSQAQMKWSPDGSQLLATVDSTKTTYLLKADGINTDPRDVTAILQSVEDNWSQQKQEKEAALRNGLKTNLQRTIADNFNILSWSPDETKILYQASTSAQLPLIITPRLPGINNMQEQRQLKQNSIYVYDTKEDTNLSVIPALPDNCSMDIINCKLPITWFPDSSHLIYVNNKKITIMEYDGSNATTVYAGPFVDSFVAPWPTGSKIVILTNLSNPEVPPTFYTIGLK